MKAVAQCPAKAVTWAVADLRNGGCLRSITSSKLSALK